MDEQILKELQSLKATLRSVQERIVELERRAAGSPPAIPPVPVRQTPASSPVRPSAPPPPQTLLQPKRPSKETLETRIGRDWLNRIGISSLVLGVAFFILYTFQYLGPAMKIAMGFGVAGALLGLGVWLERRAALQWYARGLIGGGWAIFYFTTYAMHHIPIVRILESRGLDLLLLVAVAAGAVGHSLKYRSETITALALSLGFITTCISDVTYFTLASSALLIVALGWLVVRMRWHALLLYGVIASYATFIFWIDRQIGLSRMVAVKVATVAESEFWLKAGFVGLYWVAYNIMLLALDERDRDRRNALLTATLINAWAFVYTTLSAMEPLYHDTRYLFSLLVGAAYVLSGRFARGRALPTIETTHLLVGLSLMTLAVPLKLSDQWVSFLWTLEVAAFVWLGLRYDRWSYRLFAFGVGLLVFDRFFGIDLRSQQVMPVLAWTVPWRVVIGSVVIASFGAAAVCYRWPRYQPQLRFTERYMFHVYLFVAALALWLLLGAEVTSRWLVAAWAGESAALVFLGLRLRDHATRWLGALGSAVVTLMVSWRMWMEPGQYHLAGDTWAAVSVIALFYAVNAAYRLRPLGDRAELERIVSRAYPIAASLLLTELLWLEVRRQWVSVAWAAEGLVLVALGMLLRDKVFRMCGLGVFGVLVLKILFVDLAGAETIYRILSFIVAGVILLLASFAYARFSEKLSPPRAP